MDAAKQRGGLRAEKKLAWSMSRKMVLTVDATHT